MPNKSPDLICVRNQHTGALLVTLILALVITFLTLSPPKVELNVSTPDKLNHFIAFAALVFPCAVLQTRALIWIVPAAVFLGGAIELVQPYVGRGGDIADFGANVLGVGIGVALGLTLRAGFVRRANFSRSKRI